MRRCLPLLLLLAALPLRAGDATDPPAGQRRHHGAALGRA